MSKDTDTMNVMIRPMRESDRETVLAIYGEGIETGHATFQDRVPPWRDWDEGHLKICRLVAVSGNEILGWAALSAVSSRCVYNGIAELGIYVAVQGRGRGIGEGLLSALIRQSEREGIWTLQAHIFPENSRSLNLHKNAGFKIVGTRERMGKMHHGPMAGQWRDVILMERRSDCVGGN